MYNKSPTVAVDKKNIVFQGYKKIAKKILNSQPHTIIIECYPGVDYRHLEENLLKLFPDHQKILIDDYSNSSVDVLKKSFAYITDDRVFGYMCDLNIDSFYPSDIKEKFNEPNKKIIYGFGASLIKGDTCILIDMARWEIQSRLRQGMPNWKVNNKDEDILKKFKRGYFFEWRIADRLKQSIYSKVNFVCDFNLLESPKMLDASDWKTGMKKVCSTPFRLVPFFDSGVWGGQWMKEKFNLDKDVLNYAWSFDGVPEENSIYLKYGDTNFEIPAMNIVKFHPLELMGEKSVNKFGAEFPIRFDLLDTIGGGNLSLQVHPLKEYIKTQFGMDYTQDESYYILDCIEKSNPVVYLGIKEGVNKKNFYKSIKEAQEKELEFNVDKYINKIQVKKHDHFSIPAGTVHCSGKDVMVLEISATPYIFTFKLWDWNRLGLDNKPRPIHLEHGLKNIDYTRDTTWIENNLINQIEKISSSEEKTGLHTLEFIETRRFTTNEVIKHSTNGKFHMYNLVEGKTVRICSPENKFVPYKIFYAETFIIPANIGSYLIDPLEENVIYIKAFIKE